MALNSFGVLDVSIVTDTLIQLLTDSINNWPLWMPTGNNVSGEVAKFTINVTGAAPDAIRTLGQTQLSLYLFHVTQDPYHRNTPVYPPNTPSVPAQRAQVSPAQPLSLNLYYLLSAYSQDDYHHEQQAMSIAMQCFHQHPIVRTKVTIPVSPAPAPLLSQAEEFTLSLEVEGIDSLSRLWQSVTVSMRLAAIYKVSVIFLTPPLPDKPVAAGVRQYNLSTNPATLPFNASGQLLGGFRKVTYTSPRSSAGAPVINSYDSTSAASGQTFQLFGAGLSDGNGNPNPTAKRLYLVSPAGVEQEISNWIIPIANPNPPPASITADSHLTLQVPGAGAPAPGLYQLAVGSDKSQGDAITFRSNAVPFCVAPGVSGLPASPAPPILSGATIHGSGFISGQTSVLLDTVALAEGPAQPGNFQITGGNALTFQLPANIPPGLYPLRIRVNNIESDPSWWVSI